MAKKRRRSKSWLGQLISGIFALIWNICKGSIYINYQLLKGLTQLIFGTFQSTGSSKNIYVPMKAAPVIKLKPDDSLLELTPIEFEQYVGKLFKQEGYQVRETAATGDNGVDLFIEDDETFGIVQCKRYNGTVGEPILRDLYGSMFAVGANVAYLVTTGTFSRQAFKFAEDKPIELIDGEELAIWRKELEESDEHVAEDFVKDAFPVLPLIIFAIVAITIGLLAISSSR